MYKADGKKYALYGVLGVVRHTNDARSKGEKSDLVLGGRRG